MLNVVMTFGPDGAYRHPDHIAISQLSTAAIVATADPGFADGVVAAGRPHAVAKLYYLAGAGVGGVSGGCGAAGVDG